MSIMPDNLKASEGVMAVFKGETELIKATQSVREKFGLTKFDVFTPYPVHGLDSAMGLKRSWLPWITFGAGLSGTISALALEIWTSAIDWPINVGGKPMISLPAFIPITFELTVLFGGLATVGALFYVCGIPDLAPKILHPRITNDRFVLFVPSTETNYKEQEVTQFLKTFNPEEVTVVL
jgi:hypothetical protein